MDIEKVDNFYRILDYANNVELDNLSPVEFASLYLVKYKYKNTSGQVELPHDELSLQLMLEYINLTAEDSIPVDTEFVKNNIDLINVLAKNSDNALISALQLGIELFDLMNILWQLKKMGLFEVDYDFTSENLDVEPTFKVKKYIDK